MMECSAPYKIPFDLVFYSTISSTRLSVFCGIYELRENVFDCSAPFGGTLNKKLAEMLQCEQINCN